MSPLITALATVGIAGFTLLLFRISRTQTEDSRRLQRAYLAVEIGNIRRLIGEPGFVPRIIIRNAGRMLARKVAWVFGKEEFSDERQWQPNGKPGLPEGNVTMAPGMVMTQGMAAISIPEEKPPRKKYLYIWGYVRYHDGFDEQTTKFCHRYRMARFTPQGVFEGRSTRVFAKSAARYNRHYNDAT